MEQYQPATTSSSPRIDRLRDVTRRVGLSASTVKAKVKAGEFPLPIRLGPRSIGFISSEIDAWILERVQARDAAMLARAIEKDGPILDRIMGRSGKLARPILLQEIRALEERLQLGRLDRRALRARHRCKAGGQGLGACRVSCLRGYHTALQKLAAEATELPSTVTK